MRFLPINTEENDVRDFLISLFVLMSFASIAGDKCQSYKSIDHTKLWPEDSIRTQCNTGSCHSFATVSLVEAMHKKVNDEYIDLSERDLFSQHFGAKDEEDAKRLIKQHLDMAKRAGRDLGDYVARLEEKNLLEKGWTAQKALEYYANGYELFQEGGYINEDFNLLKRDGICEESELPFSWFNTGEEGQRALGCLRQARFDVIKYVGECKVKGTYSLSKVKKFCNGVSMVLEDKEIYDGLITKASELCKTQRKSIKSFAKSLSLKTKSPRNNVDKTREELHRYLSCQPMGMDIKGYSNILNGVAKKGHDLHAIAVAGYDCQKDEYIIKNSWGSTGYDRVPAEKMLDNLQQYYIIHKGKYKDCK